MTPNSTQRSIIYSSLIAHPIPRDQFHCIICGKEHHLCECDALPPTKEGTSNGHGRQD